MPPNKRRVLSLLAFALLAALALGVFFLAREAARERGKVVVPESAPERVTLAMREKGELARIVVERPDGAYTFEPTAEGLARVTDAGERRDVRALVADAMLNAVLRAEAIYALSGDAPIDAASLADMGLSPADLTVTACYADGARDVFRVGADVPLSTYSYLSFEGAAGGIVCVVGPGLRDAFGWDEAILTPVPEVQIVAPLVREIALTDDGAETVVAFTRLEDGSLSAALTTPYRYPVGAEAAKRLLAAAGSLRLGVYVGEATPETLRACGLASPRRRVGVVQAAGTANAVAQDGALVGVTTPEARYTFDFGADADETRVYMLYQGAVYLVSRLLAEPLLAETPGTLATRAPADMGADAVREITLSRGGVVTRYRLEDRVAVDESGMPLLGEDGDFVTEQAASRNGADWSPAAFETLAGKMGELTAAFDLTDAQRDAMTALDASGDAPAFTLTLTTASGASRTLTARRLDAFHDALGVDGVYLHAIVSETAAAALSAGE